MKPTLTVFKDPVTGEKVTQCSIPDNIKKQIVSLMNEQQNRLNNFMMLSQNFANIQNTWLTTKKDIDKYDLKLKEKMNFFCKKLGLSSRDPWVYHIGKSVFELREPPQISPTTASGIDLGERNNNG